MALVVIDNGPEFKQLGTVVWMFREAFQIREAFRGTTIMIGFAKDFGVVHGIVQFIQETNE